MTKIAMLPWKTVKLTPLAEPKSYSKAKTVPLRCNTVGKIQTFVAELTLGLGLRPAHDELELELAEDPPRAK